MNANTPSGQPSSGEPSSRSPSSGGQQSVQNTRESVTQSAHGSAEALKDKVGDALDRGRSGIVDSASAARDSLAEDMTKLRADMASMQQTISKFASEAGGEAALTARNVGHAVASQVSSAASGIADTGADVAASATQQVKTFATELEAVARRNPLGTIAATLCFGVVVGMMLRGRS